jgi:hypothetical protein
VGIEDDEDVGVVNDKLHTSDDFWRTRYYDRTRRLYGLKSSENDTVTVSESCFTATNLGEKLTAAAL